MTRRYPPARLGELTEARYRRHVTMRAELLGCRERDLSARVEFDACLAAIDRESLALIDLLDLRDLYAEVERRARITARARTTA